LPSAVLNYEQIPWTNSGFWLKERPLFISDPLWHAGFYYVQEASSMALEIAFNSIKEQLGEDLLVLDSCAAPGGKSTHLLDLMQGHGLLISHEYVPKRASILAVNLRRWGSNNTIVTQGELSGFNKSGLQFDAIVVDAPCSGEGMFRKDQNARNEWSEENIASCVLRQKSILEELWPTIKEGGFMIYSTCTFNKEENENQLNRLLSDGLAEVVSLPLENFGFEVDTKGIGYHAYPNKVKGEGFYIALLRKTKKSSSEHALSNERLNRVSNPLLKNLRYEENFALDQNLLLTPTENNVIANIGPSIHSVPNSTVFKNALKAIECSLLIKQLGLPIAQFDEKRKTYIPEVSLAWTTTVHHNAHELDLTQVNFVKSFRGEALHLQSPKGYTNLKFGMYSTSFAKSIGSRLNSLQPKSLRIKKNIEQSSLFTIFDSLS
jgi:16S rRNA C967 or C1407 C5-methylase (RsmB/RsmF family)/NOL1/NOP2/fmu family ribosome biogenesis protein